ncbi:MAG: DUF2271 domain-containing protein [Paludibacter sp.]
MKYINKYLTIMTVVFSGFLLSECTNTSVALVKTADVSNISATTATSGGEVLWDGNAKVTSRGICWSTSEYPKINDNKAAITGDSATFTVKITGLIKNTTYYVRAYAINSEGPSYGEEKSFTTFEPTVPLLTTSAAINITQTTATLGGEVTADGGSAVTERGICWNTTVGPSVSTNKIVCGNGTGSFTTNISSLELGKTYYVRAYAINAVGTAYGNEITFTTVLPTLAVLTTTDATNINQTSATLGGYVISDGGMVVTERGICWSTSTSPNINNNKVSNGTGVGIFSCDLSSLTAGTTYHARSYAINLLGTSYGNEVTFSTLQASLPAITTTAATNITLTGATLGGNISSDGGSVITERGVCWNTSTLPTTNNTKIANGSGTGSFSCTLSSLTIGTTYYARAYVINSLGTTYGNEVTFTTQQPSLPVLTTIDATNLTLTGATLGGNVTSDGGTIVTERGICWNTSTLPTINNNKIANGTGIGSFSCNLTSLITGTTYYARAYATNLLGTSYGNEIVFVTGQTTLAILTTVGATAITQTSATLGGTITSNGGSTVTERGVCWNTSSNPTTGNSKITNGTGSGSFSCNLISLSLGTTYYARAYAINSVGTAYGNEVTFSTLQPTLATISTTAVSAVTQTTAVSGGNITSDGGSSVTDRGICWSTSTGPTISNTKISSGTGSGNFTTNLSSLSNGTTYYVRAYATNSAGTAYGNEITFTTLAATTLATVSTTAANAITQTTAVLGGNITSDGGATVTDRGVCWSTTTGPTITNSKISSGMGMGSYTSSLSSLTAGTNYFARAYATNAAGTAYGNEVTFTTTAVPSNTSGTLTISTLTSAAGGGYKPKNIVAIWIRTSSGTFVKSLLVLAATRKNDLTTWYSNSASNVTDATTGATQSGHTTRTATWNGTNTSKVLVPNGDYKVCMELADGSRNYHEFTFTKGPTAVNLSPTAVTSFSNISIVWTPQ